MKKIIAVILTVLLIIFFSLSNSNSEKTEIRIMAAASLTEVFAELKDDFEAEHPEVKLEIHFAGSQTLFNQIRLGVGANIVALANQDYMQRLSADGLVAESRFFATNQLAIVFNKQRVEINDISDLTNDNLKIVIADKSTPIGNYTLEMLANISESNQFSSDYKKDFLANVVSKELDVKSVVEKLNLGEADVAVVYQTDIKDQQLKELSLAQEYNIKAKYPIARLNDQSTKKEAISNQFLDYLFSPAAKEILKDYNFIVESR